MRYLQVELIRAALAELADEQLQTLAWNARISGEIHSFEECVAMLFTDSGLSDALDSGHAFSSKVDARLRDLQRLLGQIDSFRTVDEIMNDPLLESSRKLAGELLSDLDVILP